VQLRVFLGFLFVIALQPSDIVLTRLPPIAMVPFVIHDHDVFHAHGWEPKHIDQVDIWNLRGKSVPLDHLVPKLIRRAHHRGYVAVIIDPIYKVLTGDENNAEDMAKFCNQFDRIALSLSCAVIMCIITRKGPGREEGD